MTLAVIDYDNIIYAAGFVNETRKLEVTHNISGRKEIFKNKTEFWGNKKKEIGGWLGELNRERQAQGKKEFTKEDFSVVEIQETGSLENTLQIVKQMINNQCEAIGADSFVGYIGKGDSFRLERSTLYKYKGNRENALRPLLKDEMIDYLVKYKNGIIVEKLEADDWVNIRAIKDNGIVITSDKDVLGCPVRSYNPNASDLGIQDGRCFGDIYQVYKEDKNGIMKPVDVKGIGRKFFYYQLVYGDDVDNYRANCVSEKDWGKISAFNSIKDTRNDLEALEAIRDVYKTLYPTEMEITGWRGDTFVIDWLYVFNEIWDMARMRRTPDDIVIGSDVLKKFKLI